MPVETFPGRNHNRSFGRLTIAHETHVWLTARFKATARRGRVVEDSFEDRQPKLGAAQADETSQGTDRGTVEECEKAMSGWFRSHHGQYTMGARLDSVPYYRV